MGYIHLIFLIFVLTSNGNTKRISEEETLMKMLKEQFAGERSLSICGKPEIEPDVNQKIVGGKPAKPHSWPWQVSLQKYDFFDGTSKHFCGGSIISNNIVLTAAHCFINKNITDILVLAGAHHKTNKNDETLQKSRIKTAIKRNYFDGYRVINDIAILILETPFTFNDKTSPVCLPKKSSIASGTCYATGWGITFNTDDENILNQVQLPIVEKDVCRTYYNVTGEHLCAGIEDGKSICRGDSGGPFVCLNTHDNRWYLQGIASLADEYCKTISIFTRVVNFLDWINKYTGFPIE